MTPHPPDDTDAARQHLHALAERVDAVLYLSERREGEGFRTVYVSPPWPDLLGREADGRLRPLAARVHEDDLALHAEGDARLLAGESIEQEYRVLGPDGQPRWVLDRASPRRGPEGELLVDGILVDVTERRLTLDRLAEAEATVSRITESVEEHLYTLEVLPDGTLDKVYTGPGTERFLGGPAGPGGWEAAIHADDRPTVEAGRRVLRRGEPCELEYRLVGLDGRVRWVLDRCRPRPGGDPRRLVDGIALDITERVLAEQERRRGAAESRAFAAEQAALRRVAVAVARETETGELLCLVAEEAGRLLDAAEATVVRVAGDEAVVAGSWTAARTAAGPAGAAAALADQDVVARAVRDGRPARDEASADEPDTSAVAAPVFVRDKVWGAIAARAPRGRAVPLDAEGRLSRLADLVALGLAGAQARRELARSNARLASVLEAIDDYLFAWEYSAEEAVVPRFESVPAAEFLGGPAPGDPDDLRLLWRSRVHPDDRRTFQELVDARHAGSSAAVEYRIRQPDGRVRWVYERLRAQHLPGGGWLAEGIVTDTTRLRAVESELLASEARFATLADVLPVALHTFDEEGRCRYVNPRWTALTGWTRSDVVGRRWLDVIDEEDRQRVRAAGRRAIESGTEFMQEIRIRRPDGELRWVIARASTARGPDGEVLGHVGTLEDVTDRRRVADELLTALEDMNRVNAALDAARTRAEEQARTDVLTGTWNRRHFIEVLDRELDRAVRSRTAAGVILLDVDHFKRVNDDYGHGTGDDVLVEIAHRIRGAVRPYDFVARWGGEEFAVLVPAVPDDGVLRRIGEEIRVSITGAPFTAAGGRLGMTASVGAARMADGLTSVDALVDAADRALYLAKRRGRNQVRLVGDGPDDDGVPGGG